MIERWKNDDRSETVLITYDPPRPSLLQRIWGFVGKALIVLLFSAFPLWLLKIGIIGLITKKVRLMIGYTVYGYEAVGWSWLLIGFAFGFFPFVFREELARWLKWSLWLIATVSFVTGLFRLAKGI